jgi:hypothetical protein
MASDLGSNSLRGVAAEGVLDRLGDAALDDDADAERSAGDADLGHRQVLVDAGVDALDQDGTGVALLDQLLDAGGAHPHQGELGEDEEEVHPQQGDADGPLEDIGSTHGFRRPCPGSCAATRP